MAGRSSSHEEVKLPPSPLNLLAKRAGSAEEIYEEKLEMKSPITKGSEKSPKHADQSPIVDEPIDKPKTQYRFNRNTQPKFLAVVKQVASQKALGTDNPPTIVDNSKGDRSLRTGSNLGMLSFKPSVRKTM